MHKQNKLNDENFIKFYFSSITMYLCLKIENDRKERIFNKAKTTQRPELDKGYNWDKMMR